MTVCHEHLGDVARVRRLWVELGGRVPDDHRVWQSLRQLGNIEDAPAERLLAAQQLLNIHPVDPKELLTEQALALELLGRWDEAVEAWESCLTIESDPHVFKCLAEIEKRSALSELADVLQRWAGVLVGESRANTLTRLAYWGHQLGEPHLARPFWPRLEEGIRSRAGNHCSG